MMLKAPFPYFGGKSRAAALVWPRFGAVRNYVEPFFGSGAMLLARPQGWSCLETVNDIDGLLSNFWRAIKADPESTAHYADWPVNENDLHARHAWLVERKDSLQSRLEGDPEYFDVKIAGWWVWGMGCWIAGGFCSGKGPWHLCEVDGSHQLVRLGNAGRGVNRQLVRLGNAGRGVNRQLVHLGNAGRGVNRQLVHLGSAGQGVNRKRPAITNDAVGVANKTGILEWFESLSARLARVRVCCGDWKRICGPTPTVKQGLTAVFLDPPYADTAKRCPQLYRCESLSVAHEVREWCLEHGDDPQLRIALCGYEGEHKMPRSWICIQGKATNAGYASQNRCPDNHSINSHRERIWFSPHCLRATSAGKIANVRTLVHVG
jgi:D12 class N6 adenine-specific DNA methyltransferase